MKHKLQTRSVPEVIRQPDNAIAAVHVCIITIQNQIHGSYSSWKTKFPVFSLHFHFVISVVPVYSHNKLYVKVYKCHSIDITQQFFLLLSWHWIYLFKFLNSLCFPCLELRFTIFPAYPMEWEPCTIKSVRTYQLDVFQWGCRRKPLYPSLHSVCPVVLAPSQTCQSNTTSINQSSNLYNAEFLSTCKDSKAQKIIHQVTVSQKQVEVHQQTFIWPREEMI